MAPIAGPDRPPPERPPPERPAAGLLGQIEAFCALVRHSGVPVSTAEVIDAARAAAAIGVDRSDRLRAALAAALIKRPADRDGFDALFDLFFRRPAALAAAAGGLADALAERAPAASPDDAAQLAAQLAERAADLDPLARALAGLAEPALARLVAAAARDIELSEIRTPLQIGFYSYRLLDALGIREAEARLRQIIAQLGAGAAQPGGSGADAATAGDAAGGGAGGTAPPTVVTALGQVVAERADRLRGAIRDYVSDEFERRNPGFMRELANRALSEKPLSRLTESEVADLRAEVERLARLLRTRASRVPRRHRPGRLDLGRTLRRSLSTGGIPFVLHRRARTDRRPRLVVLCDVSDSVRTVSRFMLQLVYTLHALFDRVYSFAFVADLGEATDLMARCQLERAVQLVYDGAVVSTFASSNYGRALAQFCDRHMDKVTSRTTVVVIGDGRSNYHPPRADALAAIRRRAKQVWWLNPESPAVWGFGDSAMHAYRPHCDRVVVAHNLDSLRRVIDELVM